MADIRSTWVNVLGAIAGAVMFGYGLVRMAGGFTLTSLVLAVLGFLVLGWAVLDRRRYRRGTPESEVNGGHTIE